MKSCKVAPLASMVLLVTAGTGPVPQAQPRATPAVAPAPHVMMELNADESAQASTDVSLGNGWRRLEPASSVSVSGAPGVSYGGVQDTAGEAGAPGWLRARPCLVDVVHCSGGGEGAPRR